MLKSRSSGDSRSNSVEFEEQRQINQSSGANEITDALEAETDKNCLSIRKEHMIPNSPPPSYEHVLEEVNALCIYSK